MVIRCRKIEAWGAGFCMITEAPEGQNECTQSVGFGSISVGIVVY